MKAHARVGRERSPHEGNTVALPPEIAGVLFDLDGVLLDSARAWHQVISIGVERSGFSPVTFETFIATFGQGPEADRRDYFPSWTVDQVNAFYAETFPQQLHVLQLMAGAETVLETLRARGLKIAVVTNTPRELAVRVLDQLGLSPRIDALAAAGDAPEKPKPDLILLALSRLGLKGDEVIYVGDSESDRGAAQAAGVFMVGHHHPGDLTITSLDQLEEIIPSLRAPA